MGQKGLFVKPDPDGEVVKEADAKDALGPEPGKVPKPEAQVSSGSEPRTSDRPLPKKPRKTRIEGSQRLTCRTCDHFLGELKADGPWEFLTTCHRCKAENRMVHSLV
jgi:hypothetical protein